MARTTQRKKQFAGRDKSWLNFNRRVLEEAQDPTNPILERVKFLAITGSNLDEYVEIRLAGLLQRTEDGHTEPGYDGLPPQESLEILTHEMHDFVAAQYRCWKDQLLPELRQHGIRLLEWEELSEVQCKAASEYFQREVDPLLTPITIDPAHPFPRVLNRALCLAILLRRSEEHTSELQSHHDLVCRLLLEKKKQHHYYCASCFSQILLQFVSCIEVIMTNVYTEASLSPLF